MPTATPPLLQMQVEVVFLFILDDNTNNFWQLQTQDPLPFSECEGKFFPFYHVIFSLLTNYLGTNYYS